MTLQELKNNFINWNKEAAKWEMKFRSLKQQYKNGEYTNKSQAKEELLIVRTKFRDAQKQRNYYRKQFRLACEAEGLNWKEQLWDKKQD